MDEVYKFLRDNVIFYVATVNEGLPEVRPFGAVDIFDGRLCLQTGNVKKVFKQIMKEPRIAISATSKDGMSWIRLSATAVRDDRREARQHMLDANPVLKEMYAADDGNCEVLYLKNATAVFYSFTSAPRTVSF